MTSEITSANPVVRSVIEGAAPRPAQVAASRGALPLSQADLLEILVHFTNGSDAELKENALTTLRNQEAAALIATLRSPQAAPAVLGFFASHEGFSPDVYETVITNSTTPGPAIESFAARTQNAELLERLSLNQQLLIQNPGIIDAILQNAARTPEAERRAVEVKREFFEKERGAEQIANELRARGNEAAAEFIEQAEFTDELEQSGLSIEDALLIAKHIESMDRETDDSWLGLEFIEEIYEETAEQRAAAVGKIIGELQSEEDEDLTGERISMINRIMRMGVKDRVKLAMKGDREARNILIRDPNRLVSAAVVNNPRISEQEVETIAAMRSISEDILRLIGSNRQWARSYNIMHNLAKNPRTPMASVMTIMSRLQLRDLVSLSKNRNVSDAVRRQAVRLHANRTGGKS